MIITMVLYLISFILLTVSALLPTWQIWPDDLLAGIQYLSQSTQSLNFILPIAELITVFLFFIHFEVGYVSAKILAKIFNYVRGTGKGLDI